MNVLVTSPSNNIARGRAAPMAIAHKAPISMRTQSMGVAKLNCNMRVSENQQTIYRKVADTQHTSSMIEALGSFFFSSLVVGLSFDFLSTSSLKDL